MIAFIGLSHLGLVYSAATAAHGFRVLCFDPNPEIGCQIQQGQLPVEEPSLCDLFTQHAANIEFSSDLEQLRQCELVFYSLDVATDRENQSDLAPLTQLVHHTSPHLGPDATVVLLSQVPPGYTRSLAADIQRPLASVFYQVETLVFGIAVERAMCPERYIIGCAEPAAPLPPPYARWLHAFDCPLLPMRYESAELAKIAINCFLVSSVSTTNMLAEVCEQTGAAWSEIAPALRLDKRIGPHAYLHPGLGIAGGNLERDLVTIKSLAAENGTEAGIVDSWLVSSRYRRDWALRKVFDLVLSKNSSPRIAIWGLAYKKDTHSVKNSPSVFLARALASVEKTCYDPQVKSLASPIPNLSFSTSAIEACSGADALLVMTPWAEFAQVHLTSIRETMRGQILIDPFGIFQEADCIAAGLSRHTLVS